MILSKKVILLGYFGVGKTSLIQKFVHRKFSEEYITTIGVRVDKKVVTINGREISLIIWDIAGENAHQKVPQAYRMGAHGAIFVFDVTRPSTYDNIEVDIKHMQSILPPMPFVLVGNKKDLISEQKLNDLQKKLPQNDYFFSSAKTGEQVEEAFAKLAKLIVQ
ncbi:MAG: GTP-binding protein [Cyclobacteriaceae bacterium]|nr:GTP-binding protein [Cyclobacteriaceae bacterium]